MNIGQPLRDLGAVESQSLREAILALEEPVWQEEQLRQKKYSDVHYNTESVIDPAVAACTNTADLECLSDGVIVEGFQSGDRNNVGSRKDVCKGGLCRGIPPMSCLSILRYGYTTVVGPGVL